MPPVGVLRKDHSARLTGTYAPPVASLCLAQYPWSYSARFGPPDIPHPRSVLRLRRPCPFENQWRPSLLFGTPLVIFIRISSTSASALSCLRFRSSDSLYSSASCSVRFIRPPEDPRSSHHPTACSLRAPHFPVRPATSSASRGARTHAVSYSAAYDTTCCWLPSPQSVLDTPLLVRLWHVVSSRLLLPCRHPHKRVTPRYIRSALTNPSAYVSFRSCSP